MSVNPWSLAIIIEMGDDLDWNNIEKMESRQPCRTTYMVRIKESERRPFFKIFWWNIVLHDSYQADEIGTEIEEWKQKDFKCVGDFSCILKKLYYMNRKFDYSWLLNLQFLVRDF